MTEAAFWFVHSVTVEPLVAGAGDQQSYGPAEQVDCWVENVSKFEHDPLGARLVSMTTLHAPLDKAASFPPNSRVTLPDGRVAFVIQVDQFDSGSLDLELDHVEVHLS